MPKRLKQAIRRLATKNKGRPAAEDTPSEAHDKISFLSLPAEIRNQIYEELAAQTSLTLRPNKSKKPVPQNGLLIACKQTRAEFKKLLLANAQILIFINEYHFCNLIRVFETLSLDDLGILKMNPNIWVLLQIAHVPSRDDRKNLKGWVDYRSNKFSQPYFGPNQQAAREVFFEYDIRFSNTLRPPMPPNRYLTRYDMKVDLLRTHLRMFQRLQREAPAGEEPSKELQRLSSNMEDCVQIFEDLQLERSVHRSGSVCTVSTTVSMMGMR